MAEIFFMAPEDQTIFKIGEETYQGFSPYIIEFEKYYTKSETELYSFKIHIGILGHPKCFYNTMFHLDPHVVKKRQNTKNDDQYGFAEKFTLKIHKNHNFWQKPEKFARKILIEEKKVNQTQTIKLWKNKETVLKKHLKISITSSFNIEI